MAVQRLVRLAWTSALTSALVLTGLASAHAEVIRTGPDGNSATTTRAVDDDGRIIRTTTGADGNEMTTVTEGGDGAYSRTRTGPDGRSTTSTHEITVDDGEINRTSTGPRGNERSVIRRR